jgi:hypothetical protein
MTKSRVPLFGLPHKCDVVRQGQADDGAGGVEEGDLSPSVYTGRSCRFSLLTAEEEQQGFGNASGHKWRVVMESSLSIQEHDRLRVVWGRYPNTGSPLGAGDGFPPQVVLATPAGSQTLDWDVDNQKYGDATYSVTWTGSVWQFVDSVAPLTHDFTAEKHHNIFNLDWSTVVGASYAVTSQTGSSQDFRVLKGPPSFVDHQGGTHHTTVICELQDVDT